MSKIETKQKHIIRGLKLKRKTVRVIKFINDLIWVHNYQGNWSLLKKKARFRK